ncbi:MAG: TrmH family RNA methyltransferase [Anaerolineales bacterium]
MSMIYEVRVCNSCGLRYPITRGHSFGIRCPHCLGETTLILEKEISDEMMSRETSATKKKNNLAVLVDNVRSAWNVGSILRSADGFGFSHAYLCGITPSPDQEAVRKTALGAEEYVTWSHHKNAVKLVKGLKAEGWKVFALEEDENAIDIQKVKPSQLGKNSVLIVGSEVTGVDPELLELCDQIFFIPMNGGKRSFNVAIAFSIGAFAINH